MGETTDVLIVGGGITGVTAALALAEAGARVRLIERTRLAAMGSGWTLGGVRQSGRDPAELPLARIALNCQQVLHAVDAGQHIDWVAVRAGHDQRQGAGVQRGAPLPRPRIHVQAHTQRVSGERLAGVSAQ